MNSNFVSRYECPACTSNSIKQIYSNNFTEEPLKSYLEKFYASHLEIEYLNESTYLLLQCDKCGLIFQKHIPNEILMNRLYEKWVDPQIAFNFDLNNNILSRYIYYSQEIIRILAFFKKPLSTIKVFDFGMGWGRWALMAKAFGCDSYGTELSKERINYAERNEIKVISYKDIHKHKYDFINTEQVFEHIPEPLTTLKHLTKALKNGGIIKISVPNCRNIIKLLKKNDWSAQKGSKNSLNAVAPLEHINCYHGNSLTIMANLARLKEFFMPIKLQYQYATNWRGRKNIFKNILRPIYLNILKRSNYIFFIKRTKEFN